MWTIYLFVFSAILMPFTVVIADLDVSNGNRNEALKPESSRLGVPLKLANSVIMKHYDPDLSDDKLLNLIYILVSNHINNKKSQQLPETQEESNEINNGGESQENSYENPLLHNYIHFLHHRISLPENLYHQRDQENLRDDTCYGVPCRIFQIHDQSSDEYKQLPKDSFHLKKLLTLKEKAKKQDGLQKQILIKKGKKQEKTISNMIVF